MISIVSPKGGSTSWKALTKKKTDLGHSPHWIRSSRSGTFTGQPSVMKSLTWASRSRWKKKSNPSLARESRSQVQQLVFSHMQYVHSWKIWFLDAIGSWLDLSWLVWAILPSGKRLQKKLWKITMLLMGKHTIKSPFSIAFCMFTRAILFKFVESRSGLIHKKIARPWRSATGSCSYAPKGPGSVKCRGLYLEDHQLLGTG